MTEDQAPPGALWFGAAYRNKEPIGEALREVLPNKGTVVEIAAGGGQHAAHFSGLFPHLTWQPTEPEAARRASIEAWRRHTGHDNFLAPLDLDLLAPWPIEQAQAIYACNVVHVSPRPAATALLAGAAQVLPPGGPLCVYGPFKRSGAFTTPSNEAFDQTVRGWHPSYGIRDLDELIAEGESLGLAVQQIRDMPANNFLVVWRRSEQS